MSDFAKARRNMIESQIRPGGVIDLKVIAAMAEVPREAFVPEDQRDHAYIDEDLFIGNDGQGAPRYLMEPMTFARMLQLAEIHHDDCALDVGCATGYSTAVLSRIAQSVIGLERDDALAARAGETLEALGYTNAAVVQGAHDEGLAKEAPFDVIIINGRIETTPETLLSQLKDLGRLVAVFGPEHAARIRVWTRRGDAVSFVDEHDAAVPALPGFARAEPAFAF
ncbi:protein-L-isoaspartate O-methyltransferase [Thermopetrobacter sp. TC1]|uniref:protein-L-isoaspartate O-methyltransferase family protein n=1 Tax=Thermopetrobacter sp. TC1 TaxID=1495045 RepID=UPI0005715E51|nr:protein-L-isoaspartate O-methyltransferase [Thermopetrobacter sp. TC1]